MNNIGKFFFSLTSLCLILAAGCQKDDVPELNSRILLSVDLERYQSDAYVAAYTSDGKLLNYGSLADSSKWELKGKCRENSIDILFFTTWNGMELRIDHFRNVPIGQLFEVTKPLGSPSPQYFQITLKVEDFGNDLENSTSSTLFESLMHDFARGSNNINDYIWAMKKDGYTYKPAYIESDPIYQGRELIIFERGTNIPFVCYLDIPASELAPGDTITLNKSDFTPGEVKTIQVNSSNNEFDNMFLYTYNSIDGRKDLMTSFDQVIPHTSGEKYIKYVASDILPVNNWKFNYFTSSGSTSYTIRSNKEVPSSIEIRDLTGYKIALRGNQFYFTHSPVFPDKSIVSSIISFSKAGCNNFIYNLYFDGVETVGSTIITPFEIPPGIVAKSSIFLEIDSLDWNPYRYSQSYSNLPDISTLGILKNSLLSRNDTISSSTSDYTNEDFSIYLRDQYHEPIGSESSQNAD